MAKAIKKASKSNLPVKARTEIIFTSKDAKEITKEQADKVIAQIRASGRKLKRETHLATIGLLMHWQAHGDWTKLVPLREAIESSMGGAMRNGFDKFVKAFSSLMYSSELKDKTGKKVGGFVNVSRDKSRLFNLEGNDTAPEGTVQRVGALRTPFWTRDFGDKPIHAYDFQKALENFLKTAKRELERKAEAKAAEAKRILITAEEEARLETFAKSFGITIEGEKEESKAPAKPARKPRAKKAA